MEYVFTSLRHQALSWLACHCSCHPTHSLSILNVLVWFVSLLSATMLWANTWIKAARQSHSELVKHEHQTEMQVEERIFTQKGLGWAGWWANHFSSAVNRMSMPETGVLSSSQRHGHQRSHKAIARVTMSFLLISVWINKDLKSSTFSSTWYYSCC